MSINPTNDSLCEKTDEQHVVSFIDLSGFSSFVNSDLNSATVLLSRFYNIAQELKIRNEYQGLRLILYSDSMMLIGNDISSVVNYCSLLFRECLRSNRDLTGFPLLPRGGIARGKVIVQDRNEAPLVTKEFIVSPALVHAVHLEKLTEGQRLIISASSEEEIEHFWNINIKSILYDQPRLSTNRVNYHYRDVLWARDLGLERENARLETLELIQTAAALFRQTATAKYASQYAETLRICMLSYSQLLEPYSDDDFIENLVDNTILPFPNEAVWLGFLEMIFSSPDDWHFQINAGINRFFRNAIVAPTWGKVIKTLLLPENRQLLQHVQEMINLGFNRDHHDLFGEIKH